MRKNNIIFRSFLPQDAVALAYTLRAEDRRELAASHPGQEPASLIAAFARASRCAFSLLYCGKVAAVCGVVAPCLMGTRAQVWLLTGEEVKKIPKSFFRIMRGLVRYFLEIYPELFVFTDSRYKRALRFAKHLGARSTGSLSVGKNISFLEFIFRRNNNGRSH